VIGTQSTPRAAPQIAIGPGQKSHGTVGSQSDDVRTLEFRETVYKPSQRGIRGTRYLASVSGQSRASSLPRHSVGAATHVSVEKRIFRGFLPISLSARFVSCPPTHIRSTNPVFYQNLSISLFDRFKLLKSLLVDFDDDASVAVGHFAYLIFRRRTHHLRNL